MSLGPGETTVQAGGEPGDGGCLAPSGVRPRTDRRPGRP